ncbi:ATP-binding cassette domain-containing protein [Streptomyces caniscabiei]|uniref:ATP-binding cassette domain-containing protein n=1 Tax=Streptomyces caniscabiei TaxID=2746961 RepID=UPI0038F7D4C8
MAPFLLDKYRTAGARIDRTTDQATWRSARISLVGGAAGGLAHAVVWVALALLVFAGQISGAAVGTAFLALGRVSAGLDGVVGYGAQLFRTGMYLDDWADFIDEAGGHRIDRGSQAPAAPAVVRAENITFQYPSADRPALEDVSLEVRRGEVVALVGENGSGKTTLSKILSALYLPDQGAVSWDGIGSGAWTRMPPGSVSPSYRSPTRTGPCQRGRTSPSARPPRTETPQCSPRPMPQAPTRSSTGCAAG